MFAHRSSEEAESTVVGLQRQLKEEKKFKTAVELLADHLQDFVRQANDLLDQAKTDFYQEKTPY